MQILATIMIAAVLLTSVLGSAALYFNQVADFCAIHPRLCHRR